MTYIGLDDEILDNLDNPTEEVFGVRLLPDGLASNVATWGVGSFNCRLSTLRQALGPSLGPSGDGKTTEEWHFETPFGPATLYDYKGFNCSIGGQTKAVVKPLINYINHMIKTRCKKKDETK